jgi:hypothetical protein
VGKVIIPWVCTVQIVTSYLLATRFPPAADRTKARLNLEEEASGAKEKAGHTLSLLTMAILKRKGH